MTDLPELESLWDSSHPAETEGRMRSVLPAARASGDRAYWASLLTQIARAQGLQGRFAEGHASLDEAQGIAPDEAVESGLRLLLERGRLHNSAGDPEAARPLFLQAWQAAGAAGEDGLAVDAAHMLGIVTQGDEALTWNLRALDLAESSADPRARRWRASLLNNLGWTYHDRGEFEAALAQFARAVVLRAETGKEPEWHIARWCVGRALRSLGRLSEALKIQEELLSQAGLPDQDEDGYVSEEVGECLLALGESEAARPHFARAHALLAADPHLARREPQRIARLRELGGVDGAAGEA